MADIPVNQQLAEQTAPNFAGGYAGTPTATATGGGYDATAGTTGGNRLPSQTAVTEAAAVGPEYAQATGGWDPNQEISTGGGYDANTDKITGRATVGANGEITSSLNAGGYVDPAQADAQRAANEAAVAADFAAKGLKSPATDGAVGHGGDDWRFRLSLADSADYLYLDQSNPGILAPLATTYGVVFPYTPKLDMMYNANYETVDLTHSNYKGYFYKNSSPEEISLSGVFTANSTDEANYLLAVIHFFKSVTKMFYGSTDDRRGIPPPVCFLSGLGTYHFNRHPVLVKTFQYALPDDVDYIKSGKVTSGPAATAQGRQRPERFNASSLSRLLSSGLFKGAANGSKSNSVNVSNYTIEEPTWVPTKMNITIQLLPLQSREQISSEFNLKAFANGELTKRGFY